MKPEELRIGNWYESVKFGLPVKCEASDFMELECRADGAKVDEDHVDAYFKGIPLTEEWIIKVGFKYDEEYGEYHKQVGRGRMYWNKGVVLMEYGANTEGGSIIDHVTCIHQLQNIYHSLTGKEL